jgi:glycyl-tRNA synthetase beta chain
LLEIGCEEIPASYIAPAVEQLAQRLLAQLKDCGIEAGEHRCFSTPRRLAVLVSQVATQEPQRSELRLGPALAAAFDAAGKPTPAALGFARSAGVDVAQLGRSETDRGPRLSVTVPAGGRRSRDLLLAPQFLRQLLQLDFPKTMRWIPGDEFRFARPIRWIVCLFGSQVLPLRLAHLCASDTSRGHRTLAPGPVTIRKPASYAEDLRQAKVEVDPARRRAAILQEASAMAEAAGGRLHPDAELLDEVVQLVEHPQAVLGHFEPELTAILPREVIITAMRSHQRYFGVETDTTLLPSFITFRDGGTQGLAQVVAGNERVLRARLADARFYWDSDRSSSSDAKFERLRRIVWLEGLGSLAEKSERIRDLSLELARQLRLDLDPALLARAALLCKIDLATEMIRDGKEFTKLQGTIGRYYALAAGEAPEVAAVIDEHLQPRFAADQLPPGPMARVVAFADRIDSIAGCYLAGLAPSGSADPYALRRQALAILRLCIDSQWELDLEEWIERALAGHAPRPDGVELRARIAELFWGRLETLLSELPPQLLRAVLSIAVLDPAQIVRAAQALRRFSAREEYAGLLEAAKRCRNILVKAERLPEEALPPAPRASALRTAAERRLVAWQGGRGLRHEPDWLELPAERALAQAASAGAAAILAGRAAADPDKCLAALAGLSGPIAAYFDAVLVNDPDPARRERRLAFLEDLHYLFASCADWSQLPSVAA